MSNDDYSDELEFYDGLDDELDDSIGYADIDWDTLPQDSVEMHENILSMELEELEKVNLSTLDDLGKWAAAQVFDAFDELERFHDLALQIVKSTKEHPALEYAEIVLEVFNDFFSLERWDDAVFLLDDIERLVPEDSTIRARLGAQLSIARGQVDAGLEVMQELIDANDGDAAYLALISQCLFEVGQDEAGEDVLLKAEEVASLTDDEYAREIIEELREILATEEDEEP